MVFRNIYPEETEKIREIAIEMNIPMMLIGEAGLGKSQTAVFATADLPYSTINLSKQHDLIDLLGQYVLEKDEENKRSYFVWKDGKVTRAAKEGRILILEELTMSDPTVLSALHGLFEKPPKLDTLDGEVEIHERFRIITTANPSWTNYEGVCDLNFAFEDRFAHMLFDFPTKEKFLEFINPYLENYEKADINVDAFYSVCDKLFRMYPEKGSHYMSLRGIEFFSKLLEKFDVKESFNIALLNKAGPKDRKKLRDVVDNYIPLH